jgi:hypothetical protein
METDAMGAQWELLRRVPVEVRKRMLEAVSKIDQLFPFESEMVWDYRSEVRDDQIAEGENLSREDLRNIRENLIKAKAQALSSLSLDSLPPWVRRKIRLGFMLRKLTIESLRWAHLSKEEFVAKLSVTHGYTFTNMFKQHYAKMDIFRIFVLAGTLKVLWLYPVSVWAKLIPAKDFQLVTAWIRILFGP